VTRSSRCFPAAIVLSALVAGACASAPGEEGDVASGEATDNQLQEARRAIDEAIGDAAATNPGSCAVVAIGHRPCGGPRLYRAYSKEEADSASLASLVDAFNRLDQQRNEEQGLISTCEALPRPRVELVDGRCVLVAGPGGSDRGG
jgi:hypothetical protein